MIDLNVNPFYDDFDETKDFHKILFRPGHAVQARELTQMQSILQQQIKRHGDHVFKNGTVVIPGHIYYDNKVNYVLLESTTNGLSVAQYLDDLVGKKIRGVTSGVTATVVIGAPETETEDSALYIRYISAGSVNGVVTSKTEFISGENLIVDEIGLTIKIKNVSNHKGFGAIASISDGIYYINGYFVRVGSQTVILSKFTNTPSAKVGLEFHDSIVDEVDDASLYDNALGYSNFGAPGAARYKIELNLTTKPIDATLSNVQSISTELVEGVDDDIKFIDLLEVREGEVQYIINDTKYAELERWLARRTFDESGDYIVSDFSVEMAEYRNNDRGAWVTGRVYLRGDIVTKTIGNKKTYFKAMSDGISGQSEPTHTLGLKSDGSIFWSSIGIPSFNRGRTTQEPSAPIASQHSDDEKIALTVSGGKAYIKGYEVNRGDKTTVNIDKAREFKTVNSTQAVASTCDFIEVTTTMTGLPDFDICELLTIRDAAGVTIGTVNAQSISAQSSTVLRLHVFNLKMNTGKDFVYHAKSIAGGGGFVANIVSKSSALPGTISTVGTAVSGFGTNFDETLVVGAYIVIAGAAHKVASIQSDVALTLSTSAGTNTGLSYLLNYSDYIFQAPALTRLGGSYVRSTRSLTGEIDTVYTSVRRRTLASGATYSVIGDEVLATTGHIFSPTAGGAISILSASSGQITAPADGEVAVLVIKTNTKAKEKTKLLQTKTIVVTASGIFQENGTTSIPSTRFNNIFSKTINLTEADGVRLVRVAESANAGSFVEVGATNITSHYTLKHGRGEKFYDISTISSTTGYVPKKPIKITFEYFEHTAGDFFSVDSYQNVLPSDIPVDTFNGEVYPLRDVLDFRPRISDSGSDFSSSGALVGEPAQPGSIVSLDYSYYLPRSDLVTMANDGSISVVKGVSSDTPSLPPVPRDGMHLYNIFLSAYTDAVTVENVNLQKIDQRRFTMRDIGRIEKRLDNVETYVALSQLEKDTADMKITDKFGLDRFKNGFFVDAFKDYNVASSSSDSMFSVNRQQREIRPPFFRSNLTLKERNGFTDSTRLSNHYIVRENVAMLPFTHTPLISQTVASRGEFINPFNVASFVGSMTIQPSSDSWVETQETSASFTTEGNFNRFSALNGAVRSVFGGWQTTTSVTDNWWWIRNVATRNVTTTTTSVRLRVDEIERSRALTSDTAIAFMRRRPVVIAIDGLMPNSRVYPFFNKTSISGHTRLLTQIVLTEVSGAFEDLVKSNTRADNIDMRTLSDVNASSQATSRFWSMFRRPTRRPAARDVVYDRGEIVQNSTTGATAVIVGASTVLMANNSTRYCLWVTNLRGTWDANNIIRGLSTGASAKIESVVFNEDSFSAPCIVSSSGQLYAEFWIPEETFAAGSGELGVMDSEVGSTKDATTSAVADYTANGKLQSWNTRITLERNADISETTATTTQSTSWTTWNWAQADRGGGGDPLAQTFIIPKEAKNGCFLSGISLYFHSTAAGDVHPIEVMLVETDNGYPTQNRLQYSTVFVQPSTVTWNSTTPVASFIPFAAPVFVKSGVEYSIVIKSDSFKHKMWIARMADRRTDNPAFMVTEQPHTGSLFKSQNASTWTPEQLEDLTFILHHAKFDISKTAVVTLENQGLISQQLDVNPIGYTNNSTKVRVNHMNHGLVAGWKIRFTDMEVLSGVGTTLVNNQDYIISDVLLDSYVITLGANFTGTTGFYGGEDVFAFGGIEYDTMQYAVETMPIPNVTYDHSYKTTASTNVETNFTQFTQSDILDFSSPRYILSSIMRNEHPFSGTASMQYRILMNSLDSYVSPLINLESASSVMISNRINRPAKTDNVQGTTDIKTLTIPIGAISGTATTITINSTALADSIEVGQYVKIVGNITVEGFVTNESYSGGDVTLTLDLDESSDLPSSMNSSIELTVSIHTNNVQEYGSRHNSAAARYISQPVILTNPSSSLKIFFAASVELDADLEMWYRTSQSGNTTDVESTNWKKLDISYKKTFNHDDYVDQEYELTNIESFMGFQVKFVMLSSNKSQYPKVRDLRVIALA